MTGLLWDGGTDVRTSVTFVVTGTVVVLSDVGVAVSLLGRKAFEEAVEPAKMEHRCTVKKHKGHFQNVCVR